MKIKKTNESLIIKLSKKDNFANWSIFKDKTLESLSSLEIHCNQLKYLPAFPHCLETLVSLKINAPLRCIDHLDFEIMKCLKRLKITSTNLTSFDKILPQTIEQLYLQRNKIQDLNSNIFSLKNLKELDLSHNKITFLPSQNWNLNNLKRINLENNLLESLPIELFNLKDINHLAIIGNPLNQISRQQLFETYKILMD